MNIEMTSDEILQAAKEAGLLHKDAQTASQIVFDFAAIIEKRTIERCANKVKDMKSLGIDYFMADSFAAAIRKLGEQ